MERLKMKSKGQCLLQRSLGKTQAWNSVLEGQCDYYDRAKVKSTDRIELPSGEEIRQIEEDGYIYLGILEYDIVKEQEMKDKFRNESFRRIKLILKK